MFECQYKIKYIRNSRKGRVLQTRVQCEYLVVEAQRVESSEDGRIVTSVHKSDTSPNKYLTRI